MVVLSAEQNITDQLPLKAQALLIYGARIRRPISREVLADLFWSDASTENANRSLRVALVPLRKHLDAYLHVTHTHFEVTDIALDADAFDSKQLASLYPHLPPEEQIAYLEPLIQRYQGDFLANFSIPYAAAFETWAQTERESLRATFIEAGGQLLDAYAATRQFAAGISLESRLLAADPLHEKTYRRMMRFYAANNDRTSALRAFERLQTLLWNELGVEPEDETIALYEQIAAQIQSTASSGLASVLDPIPLPAKHDNLPHPLTPFFGRDLEIKRVLTRLENARLVTITGAGGVGKTRLALAVARRVVESNVLPADAIIFVALDALHDADQVASAVARALGIADQRDITFAQAISARIGDKPHLLLLDNFEHVLDAALWVDKLLHDIPNLRMLVTSREPLSLYGEYRFAVPRLDPVDAITLFIDRALAVSPDLTFDDASMQQIDAICDRLEFQPLAIELAASRAATLSLEQIYAMLDQPLRLLNSTFRGIPDRQRTLYKTIEWSYNLLSAEEQSLFRGLSVFHGGFSADAVQEVCGDHAVWLESLCDKHLVHREPPNPDTPIVGSRYRFLETICQYAAEALQSHDETTAVAAAHTAAFLRFAEHADLAAREQDADRWRTLLEADHANLCAALTRAAADPDGAEVECRFVIALSEFWYRRGYFHEAYSYSQRALRLRGKIAPPLLAGVLMALGMAAHGGGDMALADAAQSEAYDLFSVANDCRSIANIRFFQSIRTPNSTQALMLAEDGLAVARQLNDNQLIGLLCISLGNTMTMLAKPEQANAIFTEATLRLQTIDQYAAAIARVGLAFTHMEQGAFDLALTEFHRSYDLLNQMQSPMVSLVLAELADLYFVLGQNDEAWQCYRKGVALAQERQDARRLHRLQRVGATLAWADGDTALMRQLYFAAFNGLNALSVGAGDLSQLLIGAGHIVYLLAGQGQVSDAAALNAALYRLIDHRMMSPIYLLRHFQTKSAPLLEALPLDEVMQAQQIANGVPASQFFAFVLDSLAKLPD